MDAFLLVLNKRLYNVTITRTSRCRGINLFQRCSNVMKKYQAIALQFRALGIDVHSRKEFSKIYSKWLNTIYKLNKPKHKILRLFLGFFFTGKYVTFGVNSTHEFEHCTKIHVRTLERRSK